MKKTLLILFIFLIILVSACSNEDVKKDNTNKNTNKDVASNDSVSNETSDWLKEAKLDETESVEELYEKAKEEGTVVVYSHSSLISDVKENFEAEYPGITVEGYTLYGTEMLEKIQREHASEINNVDVVLTKGLAGALEEDLIKKNILHNYLPEDITSKMISPYDENDSLIQYVEFRAIFYNTEAYDEPPVDNWWDLTTPEWAGKIVIINPLQSTDTMDLFISMVKHSDEMAEAYEEKFGEEIELDGTENAGYEFIKRLANNDIVITDSSSEAVKAVAQSESADSPITIAISSKLKDVDRQGFNIASPYEMKPRLGTREDSGIYIGDQSSHINAAKLMARWLAGEADGEGGGLHTWDAPGNWHTRNDTVNTADEDQIPLESLDLWDYDSEFHYENTDKVGDFWLQYQY